MGRQFCHLFSINLLGEITMLGISACLGGVACRYDGGSNEITELKKLVEKNHDLSRGFRRFTDT
jgi:hypothetical protein